MPHGDAALEARAGSGGSATNVFRVGYGYDGEGRVARMVDFDNANQRMCYTYDVYNRLHKAHTRGDDDCAAGYVGTVGADAVNHTYHYDVVGRLSSMTGMGTYSYHATQRHRLTGAGVWSYSYDAVGNVTGRDNGTTVDQSLTWDMLGRVESVAGGGSSSVLWYDADGNRVGRVDDGVVTVQVDGVFDWTQSGGFTWYYQHGGETVGYRTAAGVWWVFSDRQGSVVASRDPAGGVHRRRYLPYGRLRGTSTVATEFGYTGQRLDPTGLMDYHARLYDPWLGRFVSPDSIVADPANPHDLNRYSYTRNNPVMYTDPTGHAVTSGEENNWCRRNGMCDVTYAQRDHGLWRMWGRTDVDGAWGPKYLYTIDRNITNGDRIAAAAMFVGIVAGPTVVAGAVRAAAPAVTAASDKVIEGLAGAIHIAHALIHRGRHTGITPRGGLHPGQVADAIDYDNLTFSGTVAGHLDDVTKAGLPSRPYMDSPLTLREIIRAVDPVPDPGGLANGWRWDVPGTFRGSQGTWELVIDLDTNRVVHWNFTQ